MADFPEELHKYYENITRDSQPDTGRAWKCTHKATKTTVQIRQLYDVLLSTEARLFFRKLQIWLDLLHHDSLLQLYSVHRVKNDVYLAVEYMQTDLQAVVRAKNILEDIHIRYITYQILRLLKHAHSVGVIFGDLRIFLFGLNDDCTVKLMELNEMIIQGDTVDLKEQHIVADRYAAPRWYRPPEQLLGVTTQEHVTAYDMWALGCVLAEMFSGSALFPGTSTMNQLEKFVNVLGFPNDQDLIDINSPYAQTMMDVVDRPQTLQSLKEVCPNVPEDGLDLLKKLLQWSPKNRITADEALKHKFVADFYQYEVLRSQPPPCKTIFQFDDKQLDNKQFIDETLQQMIAKLHSKLHSPLITTALIAHNIARSSDALTLFPREIWLLIFRMLDELSGHYDATPMNENGMHDKIATNVFHRYKRQQ